MDFAEKQKRRQKAKNFIQSDSPKPEPKPKPVEKTEPEGKPESNKKHVAYYLEKDLIRRIQIEAAKQSVKPCHLVDKTMKKYLAEKTKRGDDL
ncbi:hypothetical protein KJ966_24685 [bacterium]|nr:hypothetical protein [bacterium]